MKTFQDFDYHYPVGWR